MIFVIIIRLIIIENRTQLNCYKSIVPSSFLHLTLSHCATNVLLQPHGLVAASGNSVCSTTRQRGNAQNFMGSELTGKLYDIVMLISVQGEESGVRKRKREGGGSCVGVGVQVEVAVAVGVTVGVGGSQVAFRAKV